MDMSGLSGQGGGEKEFYWKVLCVLEQVSLDQSDTAMHLLGTHYCGLYVSS